MGLPLEDALYNIAHEAGKSNSSYDVFTKDIREVLDKKDVTLRHGGREHVFNSTVQFSDRVSTQHK